MFTLLIPLDLKQSRLLLSDVSMRLFKISFFFLFVLVVGLVFFPFFVLIFIALFFPSLKIIFYFLCEINGFIVKVFAKYVRPKV